MPAATTAASHRITYRLSLPAACQTRRRPTCTAATCRPWVTPRHADEQRVRLENDLARGPPALERCALSGAVGPRTVRCAGQQRHRNLGSQRRRLSPAWHRNLRHGAAARGTDTGFRRRLEPQRAGTRSAVFLGGRCPYQLVAVADVFRPETLESSRHPRQLAGGGPCISGNQRYATSGCWAVSRHSRISAW